MISHTTYIRVRYAETDQMKTVYYANYFVYFEQARTELLRSIGLPYSELEKTGYILPVIEAHARYFKPVSYDQEIIILSYLKDIPNAKVVIHYEVRDKQTKDLIATGYTIHGFVSSATRRPTRTPKFFIDTIEKEFNNNIK